MPTIPLAPGDVLRAGKVYLRKPGLSELDYISRLWADPRTMKEVGGPIGDFNAARASRWFQHWVEPGHPSRCYCLIFNNNDVPVGELSFRDFDPEAKTALFDIKVEACHRGNGYAQDAMQAFVNYFFGVLGGRVLLDDISPENQTGQSALIKFGFEHVPAEENIFLVCLTRERFIIFIRTRHGVD